MRLKSLLLISAGVILSAGLLWYGDSFAEEAPAAAYVPRSDVHQPAGIKGAMEYYRMIRANVHTGEVEPEDILAMRKAVRKRSQSQSKNGDVMWTSLGPNNVGGRVRAILTFPDEPSTLIAGGVSGGLFKSTDGGLSWNRLPDFDDNLVVSSIAMIGNGAIYVGTGHSREGISGGESSGFIGGGLYVSTDDGDSWDLVSDFEPTSFSVNGDWANIDDLHADPNDPDRLWISNNFGFYPYTHGSDELGPLPSGLFEGNAGDIAVSSDGEYILVSVGTGVYLSRDYGASFQQLTSEDGFASGNNGATELVISPQDKNYMYASIASPPSAFGSASGFLKGAYASADGGLTWHMIAPSSYNGGNISQFAPFYNGMNAQGNYDNMLTHVPHEDGTQEVILGGIRMWRWALAGTTPGISAWDAVNLNFSSSPGAPPSPFYVHSDIHTAEWDVNDNLYVGSDGGIFKSADKGLTWTDMNRDFKTTQYYSIAFDADGRVLGGLQDNGTLLLTRDGADPELAIQFTGGDGFSCEISQLFPEYMFSTLYYGTVFRSTDGGNSVSPGTFGDLDSASLGGGNDFYTDIAFYENRNNEFSEIFVEYIPAIDNPYLIFYDNPVVTAEGDTIIARIPAGTEIMVEADNNDYLLPFTPEEDINFYSHYTRQIGDEEFVYENVGDTAMVRETPQFLLAAALSNGVYVTRQPLKTNGTPKFYRVDYGEGVNPTALEWSPDGDILYIGYSNGTLVRLKGFNSSWLPDEINITKNSYALERTIIHSGGSPILDIEVDYSQGRGGIDNPASGRVALALGGYGGFAKVRVSNDAANALGIGSFDNVWNVASDLEGMPVYSVVMDVVNPDIMMVGTEYGIWYSDNAGDSWTEANNGDMPRVPIFDLRQQKMDPWRVNNPGVVYAGSHGHGIFETDHLGIIDGLDDLADFDQPVISGLKIYPNPIVGTNASLSFDLGTNAEVNYRVYSLDGKLLASEGNRNMEAGKSRKLNLDVADLPAGAYVVQLTADGVPISGKFIKSN